MQNAVDDSNVDSRRAVLDSELVYNERLGIFMKSAQQTPVDSKA